MSIIFEALKKAARIKKASEVAQVSKEGQAPDADNKIPQISLQTLSSPVKKQPKKDIIIAWPIIVILISMLAIASVYLLNIPYKKYNIKFLSKKVPAVISKIQEGAADITEIAQQKLSSLPSNPFTLTGIVYTDEEPMAVINGAVYTEGEEVNGAKVKEITSNRVLLEQEGKIIELTVK